MQENISLKYSVQREL